MAYHLLIVEDDELVQSLLAAYMKGEGYKVSCAGSGKEMLATLNTEKIDLILLDLGLPDEDGLTLTRQIRARSSIPIIVITARRGREDRLAALELGADDYLTKPFEPRELVLRIEAILRRGGPKQEEIAVATFGTCSFHMERGELTRDGTAVRLTSGEMEMLRLFARNPGVTVGRAELLAQADAGNVRAVDVQITRLRRKIEEDPKEPRHLCTVWGQGYVFWLD